MWAFWAVLLTCNTADRAGGFIFKRRRNEREEYKIRRDAERGRRSVAGSRMPLSRRSFAPARHPVLLARMTYVTGGRVRSRAGPGRGSTRHGAIGLPLIRVVACVEALMPLTKCLVEHQKSGRRERLSP